MGAVQRGTDEIAEVAWDMSSTRIIDNIAKIFIDSDLDNPATPQLINVLLKPIELLTRPSFVDSCKRYKVRFLFSDMIEGLSYRSYGLRRFCPVQEKVENAKAPKVQRSQESGSNPADNAPAENMENDSREWIAPSSDNALSIDMNLAPSQVRPSAP